MEHIIREDYLVEAMEVVELYCDLLLARFGMLESMRYMKSWHHFLAVSSTSLFLPSLFLSLCPFFPALFAYCSLHIFLLVIARTVSLSQFPH